ncbi:MAG: SH3 domain-containing protein [Candidatus Neomarinimicrobiota bacterium]|nr:SH3 domain-containing protein [Candidatus Neomarinimicrobiota bacterium]
MFRSFLLVVSILSSLSFSQNADSLFVMGNNYYNDKDFSNSVKYYENIVNQDLYHQSLYFNLGNAYFNLEDYGNARWAYEMALNLSPRDEDIIYNLEITKNKIPNLIEPPQSLIIDSINMILNNFTYRNFVFFTSISILLSSILFIIYKIRSTKINKRLYHSLLFLSFIALALSVDRFIWMKNNKFGIIISENADAYSAPYLNENIKIFTLFSGNKVQVSQDTNEWIEISVIDGRKGWIRVQDVRTLD